MNIGTLLSLFFLIFSNTLYAAEKIIHTSSQEEIPVTIFNVDYRLNQNTPVLLWLPTEYGIRGRENATAEALAQKGFEVWIADLHSAFYLPFGRSSYNNIQQDDIVELIKAASYDKQREVILFATGRAAPMALRAVRELQKDSSTNNIVKSAILFHPNFYMNTVNVGDDINYLPITYATNLALYIVQPDLSGKSYQLKTMTKHLQKGGSDVMSQILSGVGDGFNIREPDNEIEKQAYLKTPSIILKAIKLLNHFKKERHAAKLPESTSSTPSGSISAGLQTYRGTIKELFLDFNDRNNQRHTLSKHHGKILLLNFWASWCPPCVKELPSLNRLQKKFDSDEFTVLAINIGEDQKTVSNFLKPMNINFPVLFDPEGNAVKPWNLVAFPSSFLIDKKGKIRYGLFGGIEWDNDEVVSIIKKLNTEQ